MKPVSFTRHEGGFTLQLPSKAPIVTPTVDSGRVYLSGGFQGTEFYCVDAITGAPVWGLELDDDGPSSAVVEDGTAVFNTESCTIFSVDAATGKHKWSYWLGDPLMSMPTIANGRVYTAYPRRLLGGSGQLQEQQGGTPNSLLGGEDPNEKADGAVRPDPQQKVEPADIARLTHVMICLDLQTGEILWQHWIDGDIISAPVAEGDEVYAATFTGTMFRFNAKTGELLGASAMRTTSAPVLAGGQVYFTARSEKAGEAVAEDIVALQSGGSNGGFGSGASLFSDGDAEHLDQATQSESALKDQAVLLDSANGFAEAPESANLSFAAGNVGVSNVFTAQAFQGSRIARSRGLHFNTMGDKLVCIDPKTGKSVWTRDYEGDLKKHGGALATSPVAVNGYLVLGTVDGKIEVRQAKDGKVVKIYDVGSPIRSQPVVDGGRIYAGTMTGRLVCVDTGIPELTGWPTWGGDAQHSGRPQGE